MKHFIWYISVILVSALVAEGCATGIKPPRGVAPITREMEITGYCKCKQCCGWKRNWRFKAVLASGSGKGASKKVGYTASGTKAQKGTIAADTTYYPFGTLMYIPGYGYGRVEDRGGAIKGPDKLDLYFKSHRAAEDWGRQHRAVKIWLPH